MPLDIGIGLIAGALTHRFLELPLAWSLILSVGFALLPDIDAVVQALRRRSHHKVDSSHRDMLHLPLLYVPIGTVTLLLFFDWRVSLIFCIMSLAHFIHDSIGIGWGIAWFSPASPNYYKFFSLPHGDASITSTQFLVSWTPSKQQEIAAKYGNPNWFRDMYLTFRGPYWKIVLIEGLVLLAGVILFIVLYK